MGQEEGQGQQESCRGSRPCQPQLHCNEVCLELTTKVTGDVSVSECVL